MKTALILPIPNLTLAAGRSYHLILNHLLEHSFYRSFYGAESLGGSYVILDNSAHEHGSAGSINGLLKNGASILAKEIVLPDTLFESSLTIERSIEALDYLLGGGQEEYSRFTPRLAAVAQGLTFEDWRICFQTLLSEFEKRWSRLDALGCPGLTLSVSKDYDTMFDGGLRRMLEDVVFNAAEQTGFPIHLLGWGRSLYNYRGIAEEYGQLIRSIDSAKPVVYGINGIELDWDSLESAPPYPKRRETFFFDEIPLEHMKACYLNIDVFDQLSLGEEIYVRESDEM